MEISYDHPRSYETGDNKGAAYEMGRLTFTPRFRAKGTAHLGNLVATLDDGTMVVTELRITREGKVVARAFGDDKGVDS